MRSRPSSRASSPVRAAHDISAATPPAAAASSPSSGMNPTDATLDSPPPLPRRNSRPSLLYSPSLSSQQQQNAPPPLSISSPSYASSSSPSIAIDPALDASPSPNPPSRRSSFAPPLPPAPHRASFSSPSSQNAPPLPPAKHRLSVGGGAAANTAAAAASSASNQDESSSNSTPKPALGRTLSAPSPDPQSQSHGHGDGAATPSSSRSRSTSTAADRDDGAERETSLTSPPPSAPIPALDTSSANANGAAPSPSPSSTSANGTTAPSPSPSPSLPVDDVTFVPEEVDPGKSEEDRLKRYRFRRRVAMEMLTTETSYVTALETLQNVYIRALLDPKNGLLSSSQGDVLFSCIPVIVPLQQRFLAALKESLENWKPESQEMGNLFCKFIPFFRMYTQYVNNYDNAAALLPKLERSENFTSMCRKLQAQHPGLMGIQSYLIQPIQRIPRYKLLLAELVRFTSPQHVDHPLLTKALESIDQVALHINEAVRAQQNSQALVALQEKFSPPISLLGPNANGVPGSRRLVKMGPLVKRGRRSDAKYEFLLFSDQLLYARNVGFGSLSHQMKFKLHRKIFVNAHFDASDWTEGGSASDKDKEKEKDGAAGKEGGGDSTDPSSSTDQYCIQILSAQKSFIVCARDGQEKKEWLTALQQVVSDFRQAVQAANEMAAVTASGGMGAGGGSVSGTSTPAPSSRRGSFTVSGGAVNLALAPTAQSVSLLLSPTAVPGVTAISHQDFGLQQPVFEQFKSNSVCHVCNTKVSFATGRHHCRACGSIVCGAHSKERVYISWTGQRSRTCDRCCQKMKDERSNKLEKVARTPTPSGAATPTPSSTASQTTSSPSPSARPAAPPRPHQEALFKLLQELLETTPRIEASAIEGLMAAAAQNGIGTGGRSLSVQVGAAGTSGPSHPAHSTPRSARGQRAQSVMLAAGSIPMPSRSPPPSIPEGSSTSDSIVLPAPVTKFGDGADRPRIINKLPFVKTPRPKVRSHSVMVSQATAKEISNSKEGQEENDGLSDSDDEWETASTTSSVGKSDRSFSASSVRGRLSVTSNAPATETVQEEEGVEGEEEAAEKEERRKKKQQESETTPTQSKSTCPWVCMARALFPFDASDASQLSLRPGDVLLVSDMRAAGSSGEWWRGELALPHESGVEGSGARGLFPSSFVTELKEQPSSSTTPPSSAGSNSNSSSNAPADGFIYEAMGTYSADGKPDHLSFSAGDLILVRARHANGWWKCVHGLTKSVGWAPSNYLTPCTKFAPLTKQQEERLAYIRANRTKGAIRAGKEQPYHHVAQPTPVPSATSAATTNTTSVTTNLTLNTDTAASPSPSPVSSSLSASVSATPLSSTSSTSASPPPVPTRRPTGTVSSISAMLAAQLGIQPSTPPAPRPKANSLFMSPSNPAASTGLIPMPESASPAQHAQNSPSSTSRSSLSPPVLPVRPRGGGYGTLRANSVMLPSAPASPAPSGPPPAQPIPADRVERRRGIMKTLVKFFQRRPTKETLQAKGVLRKDG